MLRIGNLPFDLPHFGFKRGPLPSSLRGNGAALARIAQRGQLLAAGLQRIQRQQLADQLRMIDATNASIDIMEREPERVARLWDNIRYLQGSLEAAGFDTGGGASAIVPIVIGDDRRALEMGREVRARGLFCQTVVFPGVSVGDARLRISVSSEHTREDLDTAIDIFVGAGKKTGVLR